MSPRYEPSVLDRDLGEKYAIMTTAMKAYPGNRVVHGALGAVLRLARENPAFRADNLVSLRIRTYEDAVEECDRSEIPGLLDAQYSIQYNVAVALLRGNVTLEDYEPHRRADPATLDLMRRLRVEHAPEFDAYYPVRQPYEIEAELAGGQVLRLRLDWAPGTPENPLTEEQIWAKFEALAARGLPDNHVRALRDWLETFDETTRVRSLGPLLAAGDRIH